MLCQQARNWDKGYQRCIIISLGNSGSFTSLQLETWEKSLTKSLNMLTDILQLGVDTYLNFSQWPW